MSCMNKFLETCLVVIGKTVRSRFKIRMIIIIIIIKPRLTRHMSVTKEDESQARGHEIVYG